MKSLIKQFAKVREISLNNYYIENNYVVNDIWFNLTELRTMAANICTHIYITIKDY